MQLVGLLLTFVVILVLVGRRVHLGLCLLTGAAVLAAFSRLPLPALGRSAFSGLTKAETVELVLDVAVITSLAGVLKRFGLLETMVRSVTVLLGGARLAVMAVPSIIGTLPVLGGAILSAPIVDGLGDRLALPQPRKASVNLVFRHAWFYVAPFSPSLVLASKLAGVPLGQLILRQVPLTVAMLVTGYAFLLRTTAAGASETAAGANAAGQPAPGTAAGVLTPRTALWPFLRSSSPLIVGVAGTLGVAGYRLPLYAAVGLGLVLALFLGRRHLDFRTFGVPAAVREVQWKIVLTMAAVMVFVQIMKDSGTSQALVDWLVGSGLPAWVLVVVLPLTIGYIAGVPAVPIAISFPALLPLAAPDHHLAAASALYCMGFLAYFLSPVHLCQVLSSQYFEAPVPRLYRDYWPVVAVLMAVTGVYIWLAVA